jgi:hypothetical protein
MHNFATAEFIDDVRYLEQNNEYDLFLECRNRPILIWLV